MEATAKHEFNATADDELSFKKESILKVISKEDDQNWFKAECNGKEGYIPNNYIEMKPHPWFVGKCKRGDAEAKLLERRPDHSFVQPEGAFLIRYSESAPGEFSMSVKFHDLVQHFKILRDESGKYFLWVIKFDSINEMIEYHRTCSVSRNTPTLLRDMVNPMENNNKCQAEYDFQANGEGEIDLHKGDVLEVLEEVDTHWLKGLNRRTQHAGLFPKSYVKDS